MSIGLKSLVKGILCITTILVGVSSEKDLFAAQTQIEDVFHKETKLLSTLESLVHHIESNLDHLTSKISEIKERRSKAKDGINYLQNPINSFHYIKSLSQSNRITDSLFLKQLKELVTQIKEIDQTDWPTKKDLDGAANALTRLQNTYDFDLDQLVKGKIKNYSTTPLSAYDCFIIGEAALSEYGIDTSQKWKNQALKICKKDKCQPDLYIKIIEHLSYFEYLLNNFDRSIELTRDLLKVYPNYERAVSNLQFLQDEIMKVPIIKRKHQFMLDPLGMGDVVNLYNYGCQGLIHPPKEMHSNLKCSLVHHNNPYLRIGPIKEEEAHLDPRIVIYKNVVTDSDIEQIKVAAMSELERSSTGEAMVRDIRVSKVAWLRKESLSLIESLLRRFSAFVNLSGTYVEPLQVVNYGIGGHYHIHLDEDEDDMITISRNRLATLLIYLNDVEEGGQTIFPSLGVVIKPEKGSAALWFNMFDNSTVDKRTLHAACPVVIGTKWAANLWFHEAGEEFRRPCLPQNV